MTTLSYAATDSLTMLRRNLAHLRRSPSILIMLIGLPIVILLLFVFVFGGTLGAGLSGGTHDRAAYLNYLVPGIIMLTVASVAQGTAINVSIDMTEGIIARFRTMAISRASVLTGHVVGSVLQFMLSIAIVVGFAAAIGFRPTASPVEWLAVIGLLVLMSLAVTWLSVALGLVANNVTTASNLPMFLMLLPFLGSGFVPTASMPAAVRWFADYQPFTPITETLRGLLLGSRIGDDWIFALGWGVAVTLLGYLWSKRIYRTRPVR